MDAAAQESPGWRPEEFGEIFAHQLRLPLDEWAPLPVDVRAEVDRAAEEMRSPCGNLAQLFTHSRPPLSALVWVKRIGRRQARAADLAPPYEVGSAIYFAAIAAALIHHAQRISRSPDETLANGWQWLGAQPWVDASLRQLAQRALGCLRA
jgi:hypothetical protein